MIDAKESVKELEMLKGFHEKIIDESTKVSEIQAHKGCLVAIDHAIRVIEDQEERIAIMAEGRSVKRIDIREIDGLWCDDITFCQETCERMDCPRNKHHIRDRSVPHSFSVEIPQDCPKLFHVGRSVK